MVLAVIVLLLLGSFYFMPATMPFGMDMNDDGEMREHQEGDEHDEDEHSVSEHSDSLKDYEISPSEVVKKVQSGENVILLDVRTTEEYEEVHLKGAILLPIQELNLSTLDSINLGEEMKDEEIIVYGRSGTRSRNAYDIMKNLGYNNVKIVAGGMIHWEEDSYPLTETGPYTGPSATGGSTQTEVITGGAEIALDKTLHDFGEITQYGGVVNTDFTVSNNGTADLEIGDITTSCSCTSATISSSIIEPGDSATLKVVFDPDLHAEPLDVFKRTVFIPTNDPNMPEAEIAVQVDILEGE